MKVSITGTGHVHVDEASRMREKRFPRMLFKNRSCIGRACGLHSLKLYGLRLLWQCAFKSRRREVSWTIGVQHGVTLRR